MEWSSEDVYDELAGIMDPEKAPLTLADLNVVARDRVKLTYASPKRATIEVELKPTVPHCHLMTLITLSVRARLHYELPLSVHWRVHISLTPGSHLEEEEVTRQANDKERVYAAFENPTLMTEIKRLTDPFGDR